MIPIQLSDNTIDDVDAIDEWEEEEEEVEPQVTFLLHFLIT